MNVKIPIRYYDSTELVRYGYGDMLLPSDVYNYVQDGIKTSDSVIVPMEFYEFSRECGDGTCWYYIAKEYYKIYEKARLYIDPLIRDKGLVPYFVFPKGINQYVDKNPQLNWSPYLVLVWDRNYDAWVVRRTFHLTIDDVPYIQKVKENVTTFFFGILYWYPRKYKVAFNCNEIEKALSVMPKDVRDTLSKTEVSWSWLLNYFSEVRVVYLFSKGHDVTPTYSVTDWEAYFVAGYVR